MKYNMRNPLSSDVFNRFEATKERSPLFRLFIILMILIVTSFLAYMIGSKKDNSTDLIKEARTGNGPVRSK